VIGALGFDHVISDWIDGKIAGLVLTVVIGVRE
jgi:hypothetical protein